MCEPFARFCCSTLDSFDTTCTFIQFQSRITELSTHTHTHTHTRLTAFFSRTTWVSRHQKGKPFWILLKQEMMGGISWTICKSFAPHSRQITMPVPIIQFFTDRMLFLFLTPNQQCQSPERSLHI